MTTDKITFDKMTWDKVIRDKMTWVKMYWNKTTSDSVAIEKRLTQDDYDKLTYKMIWNTNDMRQK